jgi:hypothetical protein
MESNGEVVGDIHEYVLFSHRKPHHQDFGGQGELEHLLNCSHCDLHGCKFILVQLIMQAFIQSKNGSNRMKGL